MAKGLQWLEKAGSFSGTLEIRELGDGFNPNCGYPGAGRGLASSW